MSSVAGSRGQSWTLRTRLLAVTVALLAAVSVIIGVVSVAALNTFLLDRGVRFRAWSGTAAREGAG